MPPRRPGIDVVDALRLERAVAADVVVEVGVAAVDDRVARLEVLEQLVDLGLRRRRPAGTITQTARGFSSAATRSAIEKDALAPSPSPSISFDFSGVRLKTTISWPSRTSRRTMLAPIRPRPMNPMRMAVNPP